MNLEAKHIYLTIKPGQMFRIQFGLRVSGMGFSVRKL